ncbi:type II secretion system protein [Natroniella sp. ANB-PHB2]|uniref:type II secretion system protein n=1 Tax=Natroniella sp. ANB-PHB2 TaxID=3384444 RepID=UPI0038D5143A
MKDYIVGEEGFTLIELMIVIAIIGIFTSLAIPQVAQLKGRAEKQVALTQITNIAEAIQMHYLVEGDYPKGDEDNYEGLHGEIEDYINLATLDDLNIEDFSYSLLDETEGFEISFKIDGLQYYYQTDKGLIEEDNED